MAAYSDLNNNLTRLRESNRRLAAGLDKLRRGWQQPPAPRSDTERTRSAAPDGVAGGIAGLIGSSLSRIGGALGRGGSISSALASGAQSLAGGLGSLLGKQLGSAIGGTAGGILAGPLGALIGGGLSALAGKLFARPQRVSVSGVVKSELVNFPARAVLPLAANPASRLFGGRATPQAAGVNVTLEYRQGAEDIIAAKVTGSLAQLNTLAGIS